MERTLGVSIFVIDIRLNKEEDYPLQCKLTCSPDGFFFKDGEIGRVQTPFQEDSRKKVPAEALCKADANKHGAERPVRSYIDACFRLCTWKHMEGV